MGGLLSGAVEDTPSGCVGGVGGLTMVAVLGVPTLLPGRDCCCVVPPMLFVVNPLSGPGAGASGSASGS